MPAHKINFYLDGNNSLRALSSEARRIAELQRILERIAPQSLTQTCRVKQLRAGNLVLLAENAAVAAKLRQLAPRLLTAYEKLRTEVTSMRIEVQVRDAPEMPALQRGTRRLSETSRSNLQALAEQLEDSPLRAALAKLATPKASRD
jgi:hypothetical protein